MKHTRIIFTLAVLLGFSSCKRYKVSSPSMSDTFKIGEVLTVVSKDNIERSDVVVFKRTMDDKEEKWTFRVIGLPGDRVEIKEGKVFVNGGAFAEPATIKTPYKVTTTDVLNPNVAKDLEGGPVGENQFVFNLTKAQKDELAKNSVVKSVEDDVYPAGSMEEYIFMADSVNKWNTDNFGPIEVPKDPEPCYFLLGDNRHNAQDSRYIGFVKKSEVVGVVQLKTPL